jgi:hypothetical protein
MIFLLNNNSRRLFCPLERTPQDSFAQKARRVVKIRRIIAVVFRILRQIFPNYITH